MATKKFRFSIEQSLEKNQDEPVSVLMVGVGGYGYYYVNVLLNEFPSGCININGVVDPFVRQSACYPEIIGRNISVFDTIEDFYNDGYTADLAVISSPIHYHVPQSITALRHGSNVLCDKPIGAVIQDVDELISVRDETGKWVMIGYQWSFSRAIQQLKSDILDGLFGAPRRLKTICLWPRDDVYYNRNKWAGRIKDEHGRWILDSPVNNAMAHFLHNLFYVLGDSVSTSASPQEVTAELYRANPIENYDTAACRIYTHKGIELLFYGSHVTVAEKGPIFHFEFDDATISFGESSKKCVAIDKKGNSKNYGSPDDDHQFLKLFEAVDTIRNPRPIVCGLEAARSQILCMNGIQESVPEINKFPESMIERNESERRWYVAGLDDALMSCYKKEILPGEAKYLWANKGNTVDLTNYRYYPRE